ncbi:MAG: hypothetical protein ACI4ES_16720 [Roseburia sp.]
MLPGVYKAFKKDGTVYYRSNITFQNKHISLGSFPEEELAGKAYEEAGLLLESPQILLENIDFSRYLLPFEKIITLLNFRDNRFYIKTPIYLRKGYFSYFLSPTEELKFDIDDLFYYSSRKIMRRQGHLFVNDYGMQVSIASRYGIRNYAVAGRDYFFVNGDTLDYRYSNILVQNPYYGVSRIEKNGKFRYKTTIHLNGNHVIGIYSSETKAAIAYNKAADLAKKHGIRKNFSENYLIDISAKEYAEIYTKLSISKKYINYLNTLL